MLSCLLISDKQEKFMTNSSARTICHFEGIVLKVTPFEEKGYIATIWTKEQGKLSIFFKPNQKKKQQSLTTLIKIEGQLYLSATHSLSKCYDYSIVTSYPQIRGTYASIQEACTVCRMLQSLLYEEIVYSDLFEQFELFLLNLAESSPPAFARYLFLWQYALHEGLHLQLYKEIPEHILFLLHTADWKNLKNYSIDSSSMDSIQQILEETLEMKI